MNDVADGSYDFDNLNEVKAKRKLSNSQIEEHDKGYQKLEQSAQNLLGVSEYVGNAEARHTMQIGEKIEHQKDEESDEEESDDAKSDISANGLEFF